MTFQVKKSNANKIDFDIIGPSTLQKKSSAKMRRSIRKGGDTFIPMRTKGKNSIQYVFEADLAPTKNGGLKRMSTMAPNKGAKSKLRSLSNDKIEEFESIDDTMPEMSENENEVTIAPIYARENNQDGCKSPRSKFGSRNGSFIG